MIAQRFFGIIAGVLLSLGALLLLFTGRFASALGATAAADITFWFQLAFIRLFAGALLLIALVLAWCQRALSIEQKRSLLKTASGGMSIVAIIAIAQQTAIWNSTAGWMFAAVLVVLGLACTLVAVLPTEARTA